MTAELNAVISLSQPKEEEEHFDLDYSFCLGATVVVQIIVTQRSVVLSFSKSGQLIVDLCQHWLSKCYYECHSKAGVIVV